MASVNTNIGQLVAQNNMSNKLEDEQAMERLSSGLDLIQLQMMLLVCQFLRE